MRLKAGLYICHDHFRCRSLLASLSPGKCRSSPAFRVFLRLCAVTCRADGGSRCGGAAGCSASVCGAPPSLRTPRPAQRALTPAPALPESGGIRRPAWGKSGGRPARRSTVSAPIPTNRTARVSSRPLVAHARQVYAWLVHVLLHYVARRGWRREASDWPPGPGPYAGRNRA